MGYSVVWESDARDDRRNILSYLKHFYSGTPRRFAAELRNRIRAIKDMPYMYPAWEGNPAYRKMGVSNYMVFYKVNDAERTIAIHRILHASRDFARHLP